MVLDNGQENMISWENFGQIEFSRGDTLQKE
jgi:hypothetical protein